MLTIFILQAVGGVTIKFNLTSSQSEYHQFAVRLLR